MAAASKPANSIGEFLTDRGWISGVELHYARQSQSQIGGRLETCLLAQRALNEEQLLEALGEFHDLPTADSDDLHRASDEALRIVPREVANRLRTVPFGIVGDELWVAVEAAADESAATELAAIVNLPVRLHISSEPRIAEALEHHYGIACSPRIRQLLTRLDRKLSDSVDSALLASSTAKRSAESQEVQTDSGINVIPAGLLSAFERRLTRSRSSQEIFATLLEFFGRELSRVAIFRLSMSEVQGWMGRGGGVSEAKLRGLRLKLDRPSVFLNLVHGAPFHLGELPKMDSHNELAASLGGSLPAETLFLPIHLGNRLAAVIYGDRGSQGMAGIDLAELQRMATVAATSLGRHFMQRKLRKT